MRKFTLLICAALVWMLILSFSMQSGTESNKLSLSIARPVVATMETESKPEAMKAVNHVVRKSAHFSAYALLAGLLLTGLLNIGLSRMPASMISIIIPLCTAYVDERIMQVHAIGRTGQVRDIVIDGAGILVGLGIGIMLEKYGFKPMRKDQ